MPIPRPAATAFCLAVLAAVGALGIGCSRDGDRGSGTRQPAPAGIASVVPEPIYAESGPGLAIRPVDGVQVEDNFKRSYLGLDSWKLFAPRDSLGMPLVAVVLDGSNEVTAAELRIGRSEEDTAVSDCLRLPAEANGPARTTTIDGVQFIHYPAGDAAMSHYVQADSYRGLLGERCYAIDLLVSGTRPEVYSPARQPPFSVDDAKTRLRQVLAAVYWQH